MDVITIESTAFQEIIDRLHRIEQRIDRHTENATHIYALGDDEWVDSYDVCTYLKIGERTLQRLRTERKITFSKMDGKTYYQIGEIKRMLKEHLVRSHEEYIKDLMKGQINHVEQRRNNKPHK